MANEIIYVCKSINNKNIREGELEILRKVESKLCFEFGSDEMNIKKRFYNDSKTLNKDYDALVKLKEKMSKQEDKSDVEEVIENLEKVSKVMKESSINVEEAQSRLTEEYPQIEDNTYILEKKEPTKHKLTKKRK